MVILLLTLWVRVGCVFQLWFWLAVVLSVVYGCRLGWLQLLVTAVVSYSFVYLRFQLVMALVS